MKILKLTASGFWMVFACLVGIFHPLFCIVFAPEKRQNTNRLFALVFAWGMRRIFGFRTVIRGMENIIPGRPVIFVGNHQSGLDMATMSTFFPSNTYVIGKKEVMWMPFYGLSFYLGKNILIDRKNKKSSLSGLGNAVDAIRTRHASIWIFPEGTRNKNPAIDLLPFKKGAFHMAIEAQVPIQPFVCARLYPLMDPKSKLLTPGLIELEILPAIPTTGLKREDVDALLEKTRAVMLDALKRVKSVPLKKGADKVLTTLLFFCMTSAGISSGCSSLKKHEHAVTQIVPYNMRFRRPVFIAADSDAGPGGEDYLSNPLPSENFDCDKPDVLLKEIDLKAARECLNSVPATVMKEGQEIALSKKADYFLKRQTQSYLELIPAISEENPELNTPECFKTALSKIPVPREIFFQATSPQGEATTQEPLCYASRLIGDKDQVLGRKIPMAKVMVTLQLPLPKPLTNDDETIRYLTAVAVTPIWQQEKDFFRSKVVTRTICMKCMGEKDYLKHHPKNTNDIITWP